MLYAGVVPASAWVAAQLLTSFKFNRMETVRDAAVLSLITAPSASARAALLITPVYLFVSGAPLAALPYHVVIWWLRDWLGVSVIAPLVFTWASGRTLAWSWPRVTEAIALAFVVAVGVEVMFDCGDGLVRTIRHWCLWRSRLSSGRRSGSDPADRRWLSPCWRPAPSRVRLWLPP